MQQSLSAQALYVRYQVPTVAVVAVTAGDVVVMVAMKALVGLHATEGELNVLGVQPRRQRVELLESLAYIPDVAVLPRWAKVSQLIELMSAPPLVRVLKR